MLSSPTLKPASNAQQLRVWYVVAVDAGGVETVLFCSSFTLSHALSAFFFFFKKKLTHT